MLDLAFGLTETSRLGCQIKVTKEMNGMKIQIPAATRNMAVDGYKAEHHQRFLKKNFGVWFFGLFVGQVGIWLVSLLVMQFVIQSVSQLVRQLVSLSVRSFVRQLISWFVSCGCIFVSWFVRLVGWLVCQLVYQFAPLLGS